MRAALKKTDFDLHILFGKHPPDRSQHTNATYSIPENRGTQYSIGRPRDANSSKSP